ncbi:hypothetical protein AB4120_27025 [Cupriavidus sp. 2KB_3]|uniref:hypothetical protein n=1 Tax=Cupriavidus TaxID=106589 RepID=UPI0011EF5D08|nr:hypothetical protein [Cupriavidus campinensis]
MKADAASAAQPFAMHILQWLSIALLLGGLCACAPNSAFRTHLVDLDKDASCQRASAKMHDDPRQLCGSVTPESVRGLFELHFVEFDDQGWLFPNTPASADALATNPSDQIDNLMGRLTSLLAQGEDLSIVVFVHGWKHNAQVDDANVQEFRALLEAAGAEERDRAGPAGTPRKVVGIYVAWRGKSWTVPDPLLSLTFWARKEAARRVSIGSSRELFARLRSLRTHYNDARSAGAPQTGAAAEKAGARPRIRTLMIGHSFGGLILYAAMSGSLIESLAAQRDLAGTGKVTELAERPADVILLINPAFEASRYEALYRVSLRYQPTRFQPPLLVSVTSIKDWATGIAFPIGRSVNTLFERETNSEQGTAMKKTPGHIDHYLTHRLYAHAPGEAPGGDNAPPGDGARCAGWRSEAELKDLHGEELGKAVRQNKKLEAEEAAEFFRQNLTPGYLLKPNWARTFCGGSFLTTVGGADGAAAANALIWNVEVDGDVIKNHDDVMNPVFRAFMRQLYGDVSAHP